MNRLRSSSGSLDGLATGEPEPRLERVALDLAALVESRNPLAERALHLLSRVGIFSRTVADLLEQDGTSRQRVAALLHELADLGDRAFDAWQAGDTAGQPSTEDDVVVRVWEDGRARIPRLDLSGSTFDEAWLQRLIHGHPEVLPLHRVEPEARALRSLCRELPLTLAGGANVSLDNLLITPTGRLVIAECKLWRNPEARRKVVAQALEYAGAVFSLDYERLEQAVNRARRSAREDEATLYELAGRPDMGESRFCDALSQNLAVGRAMVCIVGDGVREEALALGSLLQGDASKRFSFSFVELAVYGSGGDLLVVPTIPARTQLIERGVIRVRHTSQGGGDVMFEAPRVTDVASVAGSLGEDEFFEALELRQTGLATAMRSFLEQLGRIGVKADMQKTMNLKFRSADDRMLNVGSISRTGVVDTSPASWFGLEEAGAAYAAKLAVSIGGNVATSTGSTYLKIGEKLPRLWQLLPVHQAAWLDAVSGYIASVNAGE